VGSIDEPATKPFEPGAATEIDGLVACEDVHPTIMTRRVR
jgi:hypothetical protein